MALIRTRRGRERAPAGTDGGHGGSMAGKE